MSTTRLTRPQRAALRALARRYYTDRPWLACRPETGDALTRAGYADCRAAAAGGPYLYRATPAGLARLERGPGRPPGRVRQS